MVLGIICLILVGLVAWIHWTWGLFSAAISMALAVSAAALSLGYYETVVTSLLGGKMADVANGLVICAIFLIVYGVGRVLFDSLIPGNVRLPFYVDKIGGGICGFIVGVFAVGTIAIAAQSHPFGISVAFFDRYPQGDAERTVSVPTGGGRDIDAVLTNQLAIDPGRVAPDPAKRGGLILPVDSWVLDYMTHQSRTGAMATSGRPFGEVHPDLLDETFFQRVGLEPGAKHTALNMGAKQEVTVAAIATRTGFGKVLDDELSSIRSAQGGSLSDAIVKPDAAGDAFLVIRANVKFEATEKDGKLRLSPGTARLVLNDKQYYPIGTLHHDGQTLFLNRIDDYLLAGTPGGGGEIPIDFVYKLPSGELAAAGVTVAKAATDRRGTAAAAARTGDAAAAGATRLKAGTFFELKRYGRVDRGDIDVVADVLPKLDVPAVDPNQRETQAPGIMRKPMVMEKLNPRQE